MFVTANCFRCGDVIPTMFAHLVGTDRCLCRVCSSSRSDADADEDAARETFRRRVLRRGIPRLVRAYLELRHDNQDPDLVNRVDEEALELAWSAQNFRDAKPRGVMVFAGPNGTGKTVVAGWLAWITAGRFVPRSEWERLRPWGDDAVEVEALVAMPGVVVLDEVANPHAPENDHAARLVSIIACDRHERGLGTVLTTRAGRESFGRILGPDPLDRSRQWARTGGSGWIDTRGSSFR